MSKVLILAPSGFGKSTSIGCIPELGIKGLEPKETFIISATSKPLPFKGSSKTYPLCAEGKPPATGHRFVCVEGEKIAKAITYVVNNRPEIKNIIVDDSNYIMQDYYMANGHRKGFEIFKEIGKAMNDVFSAMEQTDDVNFIMMAHYEEYRDSSLDTMSYRYKTIGKMVQDYITPEGKFDIVLFGKQSYDEQEKKASKVFVTNYDGQFPAKSPVGMFKDIHIPNDLGYVMGEIKKYY